VIEVEELFRGTLTQTSVYPREVVKAALHHNVATVILAHNHPSGIVEPSRSDENLSAALKQALVLVDVRVLDHFIVAGVRGAELCRTGAVVGRGVIEAAQHVGRATGLYLVWRGYASRQRMHQL
jgi:DNA repair protein RadC